MYEKSLKKKYEFQKNMISRQSQQIEILKSEIDKLKLVIEEKNELLNSVTPLRNELLQDVSEIKKHKEEYTELIKELKKMKEILNVDVYKGRWRLIKFLIK